MARPDKAQKQAAKAARKAGGKADSKDLRKARERWRTLEGEINREFAMLVQDGYDINELETLRWDYRFEKAAQFKLSTQQLEFFVAEAEALASGRPPPMGPGMAAQPIAPAIAAAGPAAEYKRKSEVDLALVEKYLERRVSRDTRSELESVYKEAFGEDLLVPRNVDLVDLSYHASDISDAARQKKVTKEEVLGLPAQAKAAEEAKPEEAAVGVAVPAEKRQMRSPGFLTAWRDGVPETPTRDAKWTIWNPLKFWLIPARLAGKSVGKYYGIFAANFAILIVQFYPLFTVPLIIRTVVFAILYVWRRFLKNAVTPALQSLKEKAAVPPATPAEPEKKPAGAKSS